MWRRFGGKRGMYIGAVVATVAGSMALYQWADPDSLNGMIRTSRAFHAFRRIIFDYKTSVDGDIVACHQRSADELLRLAQQNGSIYIKMGQFISMMHMAPTEYKHTLRVLQDHGPSLPFSAMSDEFMIEFGVPWQQLFSWIDDRPIASASLAQVHRATTIDGRDVVIKMQYPQLERAFHSDLWAVEKMVNVAEWLFPGLRLQWSVHAFRTNTMHELDFELEARSGSLTRQLFADRDDFYVPRVHWDLTSRHILTMEYIDGVKIDDVTELRRRNYDIPQIRRTLAEVYGAMIFCHGLVHCDPHPGNVLIRAHPSASASASASASTSSGTLPIQMVLLDHGNYRGIPKRFRLNYARLWCSFITMDLNSMEDACIALGIHEYWTFMPLIFTFRSIDSRAPLGDMMTDANRKKLYETLRDKSIYDYTDFIDAIPEDLLFMLRATDMTRTLNRYLGGTTRDRLYCLFSAAVRAEYYDGEINRFELIAPPMNLSWYRSMRMQWSSFVFRIRFWLYSTVTKLVQEFLYDGNTAGGGVHRHIAHPAS